MEFIIAVYFPCWFEIKVKSSWIEGPRHVLFQLKQLKTQKKQVVDIVMPTVRRSAWFAFSECIIQTLLCSNDEEERRVGVQKITELRGEGNIMIQKGNDSVRPRRTPELNTEATKISELINWKMPVYEPPLTTSLTTFEVKQFLSKPMEVPNWCCHTQAIERCVKMVTEAATTVYSHEKREGIIRSQEASRNLMSKNQSKQDLVGLLNFKKVNNDN